VEAYRPVMTGDVIVLGGVDVIVVDCWPGSPCIVTNDTVVYFERLEDCVSLVAEVKEFEDQ